MKIHSFSLSYSLSKSFLHKYPGVNYFYFGSSSQGEPLLMLPLFSYPPEGAISTGDWLRAPRFGVCFGWGRGCLASVPGTFVFVPPCSPGTTHSSSVTSCLSGVHRVLTLPLPPEEHPALLPGWKPEPAQPFVISCL